MNEKYHPIKCIPSREKHSLLKHLAFKEFSTLLNAKAFDGICYDESIPTTRTESSIDEEMKLAEDYQKPKQEPIATLSTQHCIFVRALPKEIGRDVLEGLCKGLEGVIGVYLLPPNATKGFIKFAFIVFETSEFLDKALSFLVQVEPVCHSITLFQSTFYTHIHSISCPLDYMISPKYISISFYVIFNIS